MKKSDILTILSVLVLGCLLDCGGTSDSTEPAASGGAGTAGTGGAEAGTGGGSLGGSGGSQGGAGGTGGSMGGAGGTADLDSGADAPSDQSVADVVADTGPQPCSSDQLLGVWNLAYEPVGNGCHAQPKTPAQMTLSLGDGGALQADFGSWGMDPPVVTLDTPLCRFNASQTWKKVISGEMNGETFNLTLNFQGDQGLGTLNYCRYWACDYQCKDGQWAVTAKR